MQEKDSIMCCSVKEEIQTLFKLFPRSLDKASLQPKTVDSWHYFLHLQCYNARYILVIIDYFLSSHLRGLGLFIYWLLTGEFTSERAWTFYILITFWVHTWQVLDYIYIDDFLSSQLTDLGLFTSSLYWLPSIHKLINLHQNKHSYNGRIPLSNKVSNAFFVALFDLSMVGPIK